MSPERAAVDAEAFPAGIRPGFATVAIRVHSGIYGWRVSSSLTPQLVEGVSDRPVDAFYAGLAATLSLGGRIQVLDVNLHGLDDATLSLIENVAAAQPYHGSVNVRRVRNNLKIAKEHIFFASASRALPVSGGVHGEPVEGVLYSPEQLALILEDFDPVEYPHLIRHIATRDVLSLMSKKERTVQRKKHPVKVRGERTLHMRGVRLGRDIVVATDASGDALGRSAWGAVGTDGHTLLTYEGDMNVSDGEFRAIVHAAYAWKERIGDEGNVYILSDSLDAVRQSKIYLSKMMNLRKEGIFISRVKGHSGHPLNNAAHVLSNWGRVSGGRTPPDQIVGYLRTMTDEWSAMYLEGRFPTL